MDAIRALLGTGDGADAALSDIAGNSASYTELRAHIDRIGRQLRGAGVGPEDRVAIVLPNGPAMAGAFVGMAPWCATAPLNPACTRSEFDFYLADLDARALVVAADSPSPAVQAAAARGIDVLRIDAVPEMPAGCFGLRGAAEAPVAPRDDAATALILHTSGTTSRPKMVPLSQANLAVSARSIAATLALSPADRCLNIMPLFHIHGLMAPVLASLAAGAEVVCAPGFDALRFFAWLDRARPSWYSAVPTMHQAIIARAARNAGIVRDSRLRFIRSSSAALPRAAMAELERIFSAPVIEAYAMTEAAHQMCSNPLPPGARKPGAVGPAAGPEVAIVDACGAPLPAGEQGEIAIRGANVTAGYLNNPEATADAFRDGWLRTGDIGVMDADGYVSVTGRLKEIINRGGEKIAPAEVDEVLLQHEGIAQACTFAVPHGTLGEEVAAVVVRRDGATVTDRDVRRFAAERLANFKTPRRIVFADEIPKGPTGKIQRLGLARSLGLAS